MTPKTSSISMEEGLKDFYQDPEFIYAYLSESLKEEDPEMFLLALRHVAKANKINMSKLAKQLGLNRGNIYQALSEEGNPTWRTLHAVLNALGIQLTAQSKEVS